MRLVLLTLLALGFACSGGSSTPSTETPSAPPPPPPVTVDAAPAPSAAVDAGAPPAPNPMPPTGTDPRPPPPTRPDPRPRKPPTPAPGGKVDVSKLGSACGPSDACAVGTCVTYYGIAGQRGGAFKSCEITCKGGGPCPSGSTCTTIADGPGQVCRP